MLNCINIFLLHHIFIYSNVLNGFTFNTKNTFQFLTYITAATVHSTTTGHAPARLFHC